MRDRHLRTPDFFHVSNHPELRYELHTLAPAGQDRLRLDGQLTIAGTQTALPLDAALRIHSDTLVELSVRTQVDRVALGLRGARGMVPRTLRWTSVSPCDGTGVEMTTSTPEVTVGERVPSEFAP